MCVFLGGAGVDARAHTKKSSRQNVAYLARTGDERARVCRDARVVERRRAWQDGQCAVEHDLLLRRGLLLLVSFLGGGGRRRRPAAAADLLEAPCCTHITQTTTANKQTPDGVVISSSWLPAAVRLNENVVVPLPGSVTANEAAALEKPERVQCVRVVSK